MAYNGKIYKIECYHCHGRGYVDDYTWAIIRMPNGTTECWNCAGRGYLIMDNQYEYYRPDYKGQYIELEFDKLENHGETEETTQENIRPDCE